jgi:hypothetical protein
MSDISSFAEWEAQHPEESSPVLGVNGSLHKQIWYDQDRIWKDRDSSNDPRSSGSSSSSDFPFGEHASAARSRLELSAAHIMDEIPTLTLSEEQSPTHEQDEYSTASPSSQPRLVSDDGEMDDSLADFGVSEDLLDEFNIDSEDKEFLAEMLRVAPKHKIERLEKARDEDGPNFDQPIEDFAKSHPIYDQLDGEIDVGAVVQFQRDVYEFSRAAGMPRKKAKLDARLAVVAWMIALGFGTEILSDAEAAAEVRVRNGTPKLADMKKYYGNDDAFDAAKRKKKKKYKKSKVKQHVSTEHNVKTAIASSFASTVELEAEDVAIPIPGWKRKRESLGSIVDPDNIAEGIPAKRRRRGPRKAQREARKLDKSGQMEADATASAGLDAHAAETSKAQESAVTYDKATLPIRETPTDSIKLKKKRSKSGPTTSAYFTNNKGYLVGQISSETVGGPLTSCPSSSLSKRARKRGKLAALKAAESTNSKFEFSAAQSVRPIHSTSTVSEPAEDVAMDISSNHMQSAPQSGIIDEGVMDVKIGNAQSYHQVADDGSGPGKKHKRKRKRNHNRLHEGLIESPILSIEEHRQLNSQKRVIGQDMQEVWDPRIGYTQTREYPGHGTGQNEATHYLDAGDINTFSKQNGDGDRGRAQQIFHESDITIAEPGKPLSELNNINTSSQKPGRRDRGRKHSAVVPATESNNQQSKDHHS